MAQPTGVTDADNGSERVFNSGNVTPDEKGNVTQIDNRNATEGRSLEEIEANMYRLMGQKPPDLTDPEKIAKRKARAARYEAKRRGEACSKCWRELDKDEPVYIAVVWAGHHPLTGTYGRHYGPVCGECAPKHLRDIEPGIRWTRYPETRWTGLPRSPRKRTMRNMRATRRIHGEPPTTPQPPPHLLLRALPVDLSQQQAQRAQCRRSREGLR